MKILVTGGLGAVGSPLVGLLREKGSEVWVLDRAHHHGLNGVLAAIFHNAVCESQWHGEVPRGFLKK